MSHMNTDQGMSPPASIADVKAIANKLAEVTAQLNAKGRDFEAKSQEVAVLEARLTGVEQEIVRKGGPRGVSAGDVNSLGHALTRHPEFNAMAALADKRGKMTLNVKAMITSLPDSSGALVPSDIRVNDPVMLQRRRMIVRNLIAPGQTTSDMVQYPRQTVRDLNASVVSEGALKPESSISFTLENAPVRTVAHWTKASRQILADAPQLRTLLDGELRYGVAIVEESEMLFGDGAGQHFLGIVPQSTDFDAGYYHTVEMPNRFDALSGAIKQCQAALLPATGIVMNDQDLESLRTIKNSNGDYIASGGPFGPPITAIWGRPVVGTPVMPSTRFLVGAFRDGAQVFDREEVSVMVATENEDDFTHNLCTVLCESRLAFTVKRPQAFVYGQFPVGT
jgi:HK97 family phage major capsid protein